MRGIRAFVSEVPIQLEDLVETTDHAALQEQFRRDAQVQIGVERIGVRHEGPGRGPAGQRLQHRRLDFEETAALQRRTHRAHHRDPLPGDRRAPPDARSDRRNAAGPAISSLISLCATGSGRSALAAICQESASTESSPRRELITSPCTNTMSPRSTSAFHASRDSCPTRSRLIIACSWVPSPSCSVAKHSLPELRAKTDPAGDADLLTGLGVGGQVRDTPRAARRGCGCGRPHRVGVAPLGQQPLALGLPDPELLGDVVDRIGGRHDVPA